MLLATLLVLPTFGGCISVPLSGLDDGAGPVVTGSLKENVEITDRLPDTLAYSDAMVLGQVSARKLLDDLTADDVEWTNGATGSSGTWVPLTDAVLTRDGTCREFGTTVTSMNGVHRYSGNACKGDDGRTRVRALESARPATS